jgi:hypothetical protein
MENEIKKSENLDNMAYEDSILRNARTIKVWFVLYFSLIML